MQTITNTGVKAQALILGVAVVGCATAATITGHLTGADLLVVLTAATGAGGAVTAAHVGGSTATNAITSSAAAIPAGSATGPPASNLVATGGGVADGTGTAPALSPVAAVDTPAGPAVTP